MSNHSEAFVAFDSSKLRNAVAIANSGRTGEIRFLGEIENSTSATAKLVRKLAGKYERLTFCYEAGPTGYELYRQIKSLGQECIVVAPSLIPKKPGDPGIVTGDDIKAIIKKQGIAEPQPGDCVFLHTGHGNIWGNSIYENMTPEEKARARVEFGAGEPDFGISGCEYMASRDIALMGGDTSSNDAQPSGEKGDRFAVHCHTEMQARRGIWNLENMDLKALVDAKDPTSAARD